MQENQKAIINKALPELINFTQCTPEFLAFLKARDIFSENDVQDITYLKTPYDKAARLYDLLQTRTSAFTHLLNALWDTRQTGAYNILRNDRAPTFSGFFTRPPDGLKEFLESDASHILVISSRNAALTLQKIEDLLKGAVYIVYDNKILQDMQTNSAWPLLPIALTTTNPSVLRELKNVTQKIVCVVEAELDQISDMDFSTGAKYTADKIRWDELSSDGKAQLLERRVFYGDVKVSLGTIQQCWLHVHADSFFQQFMEDELLIQILYDNKPIIFDDINPQQPKIYLERTLISRTVLSKSILQHHIAEDIFVIRGIAEFEFRAFVKKGVKKSGEYLRQENSLDEVKYIILEYENDLEKIFKRVSACVHLLQYRNGNFEWITSTGNLGIFQMFRSPEQMRIQDKEFVMAQNSTLQLQGRKNLPVCISGFAGIGKSLMLENLGRQILSIHQDRIVVYSKVSAFVDQWNNCEHEISLVDKIKTMLRMCSIPKYEFSTQLLNHFAESNIIKIELMLDGYDEESQEGRDTLDEVLAAICTQFMSIRIWITTRPYHLEHLESVLNVMGYTIQEMENAEQINLLMAHWSQNRTLDISKLEIFAKHILRNLDNQDETLVGIPLQCELLCKVMEEEAVSYATPGNVISGEDELPRIQAFSIADLIQNLISRKWEIFERTARRREISKRDLVNAHIYHAIKTLFPKWRLVYKYLVTENITDEDLLKFGLLHRNSGIKSLQFITYSVAEYLVAAFCANILHGKAGKRVDHKWFLNYIIFTVVMNSGVEINLTNYSQVKSIRFKHSNVVYYLSLLVDGHGLSSDMAQFVAQQIQNEVLVACFKLKRGVNLLKLIVCPGGVINQNIPMLTDETFLLVAYLCNDDIAEFLTNEYIKLKNIKLCELNFKPGGISVLQLCAKYNPSKIKSLLSTDFLEPLKENHVSTKYLLHWLAGGTSWLNQESVKTRMDVIKFLKSLKPNIIQENDDNGNSPIFYKYIHIEILTELVNLGASLENHMTPETFLHRTAEYLTPEEFEQLLKCIPDDKVKPILKKRNEHKQTTLHVLVEALDPSEKILEIFKSNQADFSAVDIFGNSPLKIAIQTFASDDTIENLIRFGSNYEEVNSSGVTLLHAAARSGNLSAIKILVKNGMDLNVKDNCGNTPLHAALLQNKNAVETYNFLVECGSDVNAQNVEGLNPIQSALNMDDIDILSNDTLVMCILEGAEVSSGQEEKILEIFEDIMGSRNDAQNYYYNLLNKSQTSYSDISDYFSELVTAITEGKELDTIENLCDMYNLYNDIGLTSKYTNNMSVLHIAVKAGNLDVMHYLLTTQKFSTEIENTKMNNLLLCCVEKSYLNDDDTITSKLTIIEFLIKLRPAFLEIQEPCPLLLTQGIHLEIFKFLINSGANFHLVNSKGNNILHQAALYYEALEYHELVLHISSKREYGSPQLMIPGPMQLLVKFVADNPIPPRRFFVSAKFFENETQARHLKAFILERKAKWGEPIPDLESDIGFELSDKGVSMKALGKDFSKYLIEVKGKGLSENITALCKIFQCTNKNLRTPLHFACSQFEPTNETLALFHAYGADFNAKDSYGQTPIFSAMYTGGYNFLTRLVNFGANPYVTNFNGWSLLHLAASEGNIDGVKFCFHIGLSPNLIDNFGDTPLHVALDGQNSELLPIIKLLVSNGADMNKANDDGDTPLHLAIQRRWSGTADHIGLEAAKYMLKKGADPTLKDQDGYTILQSSPEHLTAHQYHELVEYLLISEHSNTLSQLSTYDYTPLHDAVVSLDVQRSTLELYKSRGFDFSSVNSFGETILYCAAESGRSVNFLKLLTEFGTPLSTLSTTRNNILHACAYGGNFEGIAYFISLGSENINAVDNDGYTPLHFACKSCSENSYKTVEILVKHGANVNQMNEKMQLSPLYFAMRRDKCEQNDRQKPDIKVIKLLLEHGADTNATNRYGTTAFLLMPSYLSSNDFLDVLQYLVENDKSQLLSQRGPFGETILHRAAQNLKICGNILDLILKSSNLDLDVVDKFGNTVIVYAQLAKQIENKDLITAKIESFKIRQNQN